MDLCKVCGLLRIRHCSIFMGVLRNVLEMSSNDTNPILVFTNPKKSQIMVMLKHTSLLSTNAYSFTVTLSLNVQEGH